MKKYIKSETAYYSDLKRILKAMKDLQDAIEMAGDSIDDLPGFLEEYELSDFYEELTDCIYDFHHMVSKEEI